MSHIKSHTVMENRLKELNIKLLDPYIGAKKKHNVQCMLCNHIWLKAPGRFLYDKTGCPNCNSSGIVRPTPFSIKTYPKPCSDLDKRYIRDKSLKLYCIYYKGGKCEKCGIDLIENQSLADFHHHTKEKNKELNILISKHNLEVVMNELEVCTLLCSNCHRMIHGCTEKYKEFEDYIKKNALDYYNKGNDK